MTALNLIKIQDRQLNQNPKAPVISIQSWKIRKFNEHIAQRISSMLGLDLTLIKSSPKYQEFLNYGTIGF